MRKVTNIKLDIEFILQKILDMPTLSKPPACMKYIRGSDHNHA